MQGPRGIGPLYHNLPAEEDSPFNAFPFPVFSSLDLFLEQHPELANGILPPLKKDSTPDQRQRFIENLAEHYASSGAHLPVADNVIPPFLSAILNECVVSDSAKMRLALATLGGTLLLSPLEGDQPSYIFSADHYHKLASLLKDEACFGDEHHAFSLLGARMIASDGREQTQERFDQKIEILHALLKEDQDGRVIDDKMKIYGSLVLHLGNDCHKNIALATPTYISFLRTLERIEPPPFTADIYEDTFMDIGMKEVLAIAFNHHLLREMAESLAAHAAEQLAWIASIKMDTAPISPFLDGQEALTLTTQTKMFKKPAFGEIANEGPRRPHNVVCSFSRAISCRHGKHKNHEPV